MSDLHRLAELLKTRNAIDNDISALVGRPVHKGHVGEYIAAAIFGIQLEESAAHKGSDGRFIAGPLSGHTVNIKWYGKHDSLLDIALGGAPDYYLVFTGPKTAPASSKGTIAPWVIEFVFLFDANALHSALQADGKKRLGVATSVKGQYWQEAEIYPVRRSDILVLSDEQRVLLRLFQQELESSAALSS